MLNHYVIVKYKPDTPALHKQAFCQKMLALRAVIKEIQHLEIGLDELHEDRSWDLMLIMRFDSLEALKIYQKHPEHVALMKFNSPYVQEVGAVDFHSSLQ